jgi:phenylpyruvate tautomerase PptA (4-oxalocrotonate tautomerase family)
MPERRWYPAVTLWRGAAGGAVVQYKREQAISAVSPASAQEAASHRTPQEYMPVPLVRIDIRTNPDPAFARRAAAIVYESMKATINVPDKDNFQILVEHDDRHFVYDPQYLGIKRTDALVMIQITLNEGRTTEMKKALYKSIAEGLHRELQVPMGDVLISLVEVKKENWSFGNGIAQYAT